MEASAAQRLGNPSVAISFQPTPSNTQSQTVVQVYQATPKPDRPAAVLTEATAKRPDNLVSIVFDDLPKLFPRHLINWGYFPLFPLHIDAKQVQTKSGEALEIAKKEKMGEGETPFMVIRRSSQANALTIDYEKKGYMISTRYNLYRDTTNREIYISFECTNERGQKVIFYDTLENLLVRNSKNYQPLPQEAIQRVLVKKRPPLKTSKQRTTLPHCQPIEYKDVYKIYESQGLLADFGFLPKLGGGNSTLEIAKKLLQAIPWDDQNQYMCIRPFGHELVIECRAKGDEKFGMKLKGQITGSSYELFINNKQEIWTCCRYSDTHAKGTVEPLDSLLNRRRQEYHAISSSDRQAAIDTYYSEAVEYRLREISTAKSYEEVEPLLQQGLEWGIDKLFQLWRPGPDVTNYFFISYVSCAEETIKHLRIDITEKGTLHCDDLEKKEFSALRKRFDEDLFTSSGILRASRSGLIDYLATVGFVKHPVDARLAELSAHDTHSPYNPHGSEIERVELLLKHAVEWKLDKIFMIWDSNKYSHSNLTPNHFFISYVKHDFTLEHLKIEITQKGELYCQQLDLLCPIFQENEDEDLFRPEGGIWAPYSKGLLDQLVARGLIGLPIFTCCEEDIHLQMAALGPPGENSLAKLKLYRRNIGNFWAS